MDFEYAYAFLREETCKSWNYIVTDILIYAAQPIEADFKVRRTVCARNWLSEYNGRHIYIQVEIVLFSQRYAYFNHVVEIASPNFRQFAANSDRKLHATNCNKLMLVDIA